MDLQQTEAIIGRFNDRYNAPWPPRSRRKVGQEGAESWAPSGALPDCGAFRLNHRAIRRCAGRSVLRISEDWYSHNPMTFHRPFNPKTGLNRITHSGFNTDAQWTDEWGTGWRHAIGSVGASTVSNPIEDWSQLTPIWRARAGPSWRRAGSMGRCPPCECTETRRIFAGWPTWRSSSGCTVCAASKTRSRIFIFIHGKSIASWTRCLDYFRSWFRSWGQLGGVDGLFITDDWGTQKSLMISPTCGASSSPPIPPHLRPKRTAGTCKSYFTVAAT